MRLARLVGTVLIGVSAWPAAAPAAAPVGVGWLERVRLGEEGFVVRAKLDTGADGSSLHVAEITWIRREDSDWVAFEVAGEDGRKARLERRVTRTVRVRRVGSPAQRRPAIELDLCLGKVRRRIEVNLADRTGFTQPMLVGRNFLAGAFVVDASRTYTVEPDCDAVGRR